MGITIITRSKSSKKPKYWTNDKLKQAFGNREDHEYRHYNNALGCMVNGKEDFVQKLESGGFVGDEDGNLMAEKTRNMKKAKYDGVSDKTAKIIGALKSTADSEGNLSSLEGTKKACEEAGVNFYHKLPKHYEEKKTGAIVNDSEMGA